MLRLVPERAAEIFAWTASSNNQAMVAGRLSLAMNAISITRTAEGTNPDLASKINLAPIPAGPNGRVGLEHVMGAYVIWKFAKPAGKYGILGTIAERYTHNPGYPGYTNAAIDEIFNKFLIPQMFAEVAQGTRTPEEAAAVYDRSFRHSFQRWRNRGRI